MVESRPSSPVTPRSYTASPAHQRVTVTVGRLDAGLALLLTQDHHLIEFPSALLPAGTACGSILNFHIENDIPAEKERQKEFLQLQEDILRDFSHPPEPPCIAVKRASPTSITIEWTRFNLHTSSIKKVIIFKDTQPTNFVWVSETSARLHGLKMDQEYTLHMIVHTSAGQVVSNTITAKTHTIDNLTGLHVAFDGFNDMQATHIKDIRELKELVKKMGASWSEDLSMENTHLICRESRPNEESRPSSPETANKMKLAKDYDIPIVTPEWIKACFLQKKIKNASDFYVK